MLRLRFALPLIAVLWMTALTSRAQYSLTETGWMAGGGASLLSSAGVGAAVNASGFFSHYTCGKRYGFHFAGGAGMLFNRSGTAFSLSPLDNDASLSMGYLFLAAYGKIRPHSYHRPREVAFLVGPQAEFPLLMHYSSDSLSGSMRDAGADIPFILPSLHVSAQFRRPLGDELSFFIEPGVDAQLSHIFSTPMGGTRSALRVTLAMGMSVWNDH